MAKLIRVSPANAYSEEVKYWLIGNRFQLSVSLYENRYTFFIGDTTQKLNSLKLIPQIGKDLGLFERSDITLYPSIDTCGINIPESRYEEVFKLIEDYLLKL